MKIIVAGKLDKSTVIGNLRVWACSIHIQPGMPDSVLAGGEVVTQHRRGRRKQRTSAPLGVAIVFASAVAIPLLGWLVISLVTNNDDDPTISIRPDSTTGLEMAPADVAATESRNGDDVVAACADELRAGARAVAEASTGVGHWSEHIGARAEWLAGQISDQEKAETYRRTRLAGPDDQERFAVELASYKEVSACTDLANVDDASSDGVAGCLERADRTARAVAAAVEAMGDWQRHLDDMAAHADGHMDDLEANEGWARAAEQAPININSFEGARDELDQAPDCTAPSQ